MCTDIYAVLCCVCSHINTHSECDAPSFSIHTHLGEEGESFRLDLEGGERGARLLEDRAERGEEGDWERMGLGGEVVALSLPPLLLLSLSLSLSLLGEVEEEEVEEGEAEEGEEEEGEEEEEEEGEEEEGRGRRGRRCCVE